MGRQVARGELPMPDEDDLADKYQLADEQLSAAGMSWYEVSNWATSPDHWCRHNLLYWTRRRTGGASAPARTRTSAACAGGTSSTRRRTPSGWRAGSRPALAREVLGYRDQKVERILLEIRLVEGLPVSALEATGRSHVARLVADGLVELVAERLVLTPRGRLLADAIVRDLDRLRRCARQDPPAGRGASEASLETTPVRGSARPPGRDGSPVLRCAQVWPSPRGLETVASPSLRSGLAEPSSTSRRHLRFAQGWVVKSISSSTRPSRAGSRSAKEETRPRTCFQARAMSAWSRWGQPSCWQVPFFQSMPLRDRGPLRDAEPVGLDGLPDVDEGVAHDEHVLADGGAGDALRDPGLLRPRDEVVDQHADAALRSGLEVAEVVGEVVDAAEVLHHDALDPQVVAPDLLDELGVVAALDEDPARPGDTGPRAGHRDRARRRTRGRRGCAAADGTREDHRPALEQEAGPERERTPLAAPVLQGQRVDVAVDRDHLAAPVGGDLLDDHPELGRHLDGPAVLRGAPVAGEDVGSVAIGRHRATLGGQTFTSGGGTPWHDGPG